MTGKTHMAGGTLCSAAITYLMPQLVKEDWLDIILKAGFIVLTTYSSLLCDVDEKNSTAGRKLKVISWPIYIQQIILRFIRFLLPKRSKLYKNISSILRKVNHRGMLHYPLNAIIIGGLGYGLSHVLHVIGYHLAGIIISLVFYSIALGVLSHILLDMISGKVPLFGPFKEKRIGIRLFKTGGFLERYMVRPCLILGAFLLVARIGEQWVDKIMG